MTTVKTLNGKPNAGNPYVRFDEGEVASCTIEALRRRGHCRRQPEECAGGYAATPRSGSLLYGKVLMVVMCALTAQGGDWLLDPSPYRAEVREEGGAWVLENGLARRVIATKPGAATVSLKCLTSCASARCRGISRTNACARRTTCTSRATMDSARPFPTGGVRRVRERRTVPRRLLLRDEPSVSRGGG